LNLQEPKLDQDTQSTVAAPVVKIVTAWAAVGLTSWADVAAALAALYTFLLILEWLWKKLGRPFCEDRGWIKRQKRRRDDAG
jgi:hypothetical protein